MGSPRLLLATLLAISLSAPLAAQDFKNDFTIELSRYVGLWYEIARTPSDFQDNEPTRRGIRYGACYNTTAEYQPDGPRNIRLTNRCMRESATGATYEDVARGLAVPVGVSGNRKLQIAFGPGIARFFQRLISGGGFPYWIYCLGPINAAGLYDWAVVSGDDKDFLFLLSRAKTLSDEAQTAAMACMRMEGLPVDKLVYRQR